MMKKVLAYLKNPFTPLAKIPFCNIRWLCVLLRVLGYLDLVLLPLYSYLTIEFIHYNGMTRYLSFLENRTSAVLFGILVIYLIWALLLLVFKKGYVAGALLSLASILISLADYFKFALTGDYLYPWDVFQQTGNVGELTSFLSTPLAWWGWVIILGYVLAVAFLFYTKVTLPVKAYIRLPLALVLVLAVFSSVNTPEKVQKVLNENTLYLEDMALQQSNYSANGFVGAFVVNLLSGQVAEPEGYGAEAVLKLFENYEYIPETEDFQKPDIILVLSESFWDPRLLPGVEFSKNPLENYDEIIARENTVSGRFFTTGFGGGTVRPEFDVLTGLTTDRLPAGSVPWQYITSECESYVSVYKSLGYKTVAMHPYTSSFYLRKEAYPLIGFDELRFEDTFYHNDEIPVKIDGKQITDETLAEHIEHYLDKSEEPVFLFGISMENHQPYTNKYSVHDITVTSSALEESVRADVENFTQGVYHADMALGELVSYIDSRERDTVLLWFGDHLPTLGANYAAYAQTGMIDLSAMTLEMKEMLQSTPYLIYSNFDFHESPMVKAGQNNDLSSYNLMNALSTLIGSPRTELMQYLEDFYKVFPYYNVRLFTGLFPGNIWGWVDGHAMLTYDRTVGKKYS